MSDMTERTYYKLWCRWHRVRPPWEMLGIFATLEEVTRKQEEVLKGYPRGAVLGLFVETCKGYLTEL